MHKYVKISHKGEFEGYVPEEHFVGLYGWGVAMQFAINGKSLREKVAQAQL